MDITTQSALDFGLEPTAALLTEGFTGYFVPIQIPLAGLLDMVRQDNVDVALSRVIDHHMVRLVMVKLVINLSPPITR